MEKDDFTNDFINAKKLLVECISMNDLHPSVVIAVCCDYIAYLSARLNIPDDTYETTLQLMRDTRKVWLDTLEVIEKNKTTSS